MPKLAELGNSVIKNEKVRGYLFASPDGQALFGEGVSDPEAAAGSAALCLIQLAQLQSALGLGPLRQATFSSQSRNDMLLYRVDEQCFAVFKKPQGSTTELTAEMRRLLGEYTNDA